MNIFNCHRTSDRNLSRTVREGCASFDPLQDDARVPIACAVAPLSLNSYP